MMEGTRVKDVTVMLEKEAKNDGDFTFSLIASRLARFSLARRSVAIFILKGVFRHSKGQDFMKR